MTRRNLTGQFRYIYALGFKDGALVAMGLVILFNILFKLIWRH